MNYHRNEKGIALVMALVLSLIALAIVSALVFFITQGTTISGMQKRYQTAQEAAKAGLDLFSKEIIQETFSGNLSSIVSKYSLLVGMQESTPGCLYTKQITATTGWGACSSTPDPRTSYDITLRLLSPDPGPGIPKQPDFDVFVKIIGTVEGNSDISGLDLEGMGVVESGSGQIHPKLMPYMYRMEIQAERVNNTNERANLSVLYAY
jgi:hypothetical protein